MAPSTTIDDGLDEEGGGRAYLVEEALAATQHAQPFEVRVPLTFEQIRSLADACDFFGAGAETEPYWRELARKLRVHVGEDD